MKTKLFFALGISTVLLAFKVADEIPSCFLNFKETKAVKATGDVVKAAVIKPYKLNTGKTEHNMSANESHTVIYNNTKNAAFIKLRVEQSKANSYGKDTGAVYNNLKVQMKEGKRFENSYLIEQNYNGYKVYGYSHNTLDKDSVQAHYAFFPGADCIIYIDFLRLKPEQRTYETVGDFRHQRDNFLSYYTAYLRKHKE
jgi:hypothetical protein